MTHKRYYEMPTVEEMEVILEKGIADSVVTEGGAIDIDDYDSWSNFGD